MTRGEALRWALSTLAAAGVGTPSLDASLLLGRALGIPREKLLLERDQEVPAGPMKRFRGLVSRRGRRVPVSQLLGFREFYGLPFHVDRDVLTPRPETEHLVEWALSRGPRRVLDIGTGSGAIAVALAANAPSCRVLAVDVCPRALAVARRNARENGVEDRVAFVLSDLAAALAGARFDLVLSNPPYVREDEEVSLPPEVREHEPRHALIAGPRGTEFHARIAAEGAGLLTPGGALGVEVGAGQAPEVSRLFGKAGFSAVGVIPDLAGIDRVVTGEWGGGNG